MMHTHRTELSVLDTSLLRIFLDANDMDNVAIGAYDEHVNVYQTNHKICYAYSDKDETIVANMTYISIKYGSIEKAFVDYKKCICR